MGKLLGLSQGLGAVEFPGSVGKMRSLRSWIVPVATRQNMSLPTVVLIGE